MKMKWPPILLRSAFLSMLLPGLMAYSATVTGTVNNKTNGKPSAGDTVELIDVQAGMAEVGRATTDAHGRYTLQTPGAGAYLVRVNHQGGTYFIAAPQGGSPGDVSVYDVAAKVDGVGIDAEMILTEAAGGTLRVSERYLVRNRSLPPRAQFSSNTFEFVIPPDAILEGASATRPGGMATNTRPVPLSAKGHYTINIPIQPDKGEKETLFEVQYHMPYSGKFTFKPQPQMPADNLVIYVPKSMTFTGGKGSDFQPTQQDPRVQTFVAKNIHPGQAIEFAISGEGEMPREAQGGGQQASGGMSDAGDTAPRPGGGIGVPIDTPDPLTKYKWWILAVLALMLAATAAFLLRRQNALAPALPGQEAGAATVFPPPSATERAAVPVGSYPTAPSSSYITQPVASATLLNILRDELFAIESEKISGTITPDEYNEVKAGLEAVLKRALRKK
jgi:5-hydroxyisourate hydrolase-like protein (transthyretin family)